MNRPTVPSGTIEGKHGRLVFTIKATGAIQERLGYILGDWYDHQTDTGLLAVIPIFNSRLRELTPYCPTVDAQFSFGSVSFLENGTTIDISVQLWLGIALDGHTKDGFIQAILDTLRAHALRHINDGSDRPSGYSGNPTYGRSSSE